jgi:hypothetical protein
MPLGFRLAALNKSFPRKSVTIVLTTIFYNLHKLCYILFLRLVTKISIVEISLRTATFIARATTLNIFGEETMRAQMTYETRITVAGLLTGLCALLSLGGCATTARDPVLISSDDVKWVTGNMSKPGMEQANLVGDATKSGPYTIRLRFPAGYKLAPHSHPDDRQVTVLKGTWCAAYGTVEDPSKLKCLSAGSFYTEPKDKPHYVVTTEATELQITGDGPSGRNFVVDTH